MAYERHAKRSAMEGMKLAKRADAGQPFEVQVVVQQRLDTFIKGMEIGIADLDRWKSNLDAMHKSGDTSQIGMLAVTFEGFLPFVAAFGIMPEWDFTGEKLQDLILDQPDQLSVTVTVNGPDTVAVFAWFGGPNSAGAKLARTFAALPDDQKATALIRFTLASSENIHMKPSWWENLDEAEMKDALHLVHLGMASPEGERGPKDFLHNEGSLRTYAGVRSIDLL